MQQLGDVRQGVQMLLKLALRHEKEHDELHRLVVERIEIDARLGTAQRAHHFVNQVGRGVRNADAEPDAGAHGRLALLDRGGHGIAVPRLDFPGGD